MSLSRAVALVVALVATWSSAPVARADFVENLGRKLGAGAVEKIEPALASALADAEARGTRLEDHLGTIGKTLIDDASAAGKDRLDQLDHLLETRLLQVQVGAKEVADHALSGVDKLINNSLGAVRALEKDVIKDLAATASATLEKASAVLRDRIADVGREVDSAIAKADRTLAERITQVDEAIGLRLGNVDVIASKQRIAVEETALRTAVLIGLVAFTVFVLYSLYKRYSELTAGEPKGAKARLWLPGHGPWRARGGQRTLMFAKGLGAPLLGHLVLAAAGAAVLFVLYDRLPLGAHKEAVELVRTHQTGFADSLARFDFPRARFHASQLEYLQPDDPIAHGALIAKAELLRDVFARPTILGTDAGIADLWKRLDDARRLLGARPDPDLLVVEAMLVWQAGDSRRDELRAASLCARALRVRPFAGGFALEPLARTYVETFVDAPYVDDHAGLARDSYQLDDLTAVLNDAPTADPSSPLAARIKIGRLMRTVDAQSSTAYAETIERHLEVLAAIGRRAPPAELKAAQDRRREAAARVLDAWKRFDEAIAAVPELARTPSVLLIFRLNDALYSRAKWFYDHPTTDSVAPRLVAPPPPRPATHPPAVDAVVRLELAPPRIVWARRYQRLIAGPAQQLFELQETNRFATMEAAAYAFEQAMIDLGSAAATPSGVERTASSARASARGAPRAVTSDEAHVSARRKAAAQAAAALGLYVSGAKAATPRTPFARKLVPKGDDDLAEALRGRGIRLL